mmetsp:Transcript_50649/g.151487  ORF Transcript_50649/g.151487 Transcript_50649/m.151487 type:complete len:242 (+) Transcript_50649:747-1472(+)
MRLALGCPAEARVPPAAVPPGEAGRRGQHADLPRVVPAGEAGGSGHPEVRGARSGPAGAAGGGDAATRPGPRRRAAGRRHHGLRSGTAGPAGDCVCLAQRPQEPWAAPGGRPGGTHLLAAAEAGVAVVHRLVALPLLRQARRELLRLPGAAGGRAPQGPPLPLRHVSARVPGHRHVPLPAPLGRERLPTERARCERPLCAPGTAAALLRDGGRPGVQGEPHGVSGARVPAQRDAACARRHR